MRRAPKEGYDFARKRDYRRKVWATFRDELKRHRVVLADAHALLMPSLEGDEIEVAVNAGFREKNLHIVDENPAVVAVMKRKYPKIHTYGVRCSRAMKRIAASGIQLRCANFDFCGQLSMAYKTELLSIALMGSFGIEFKHVNAKLWSFNGNDVRRKAFHDEICLVAVSALRGREGKWLTERWDSNQIEDIDLDAIDKRLTEYRNRQSAMYESAGLSKLAQNLTADRREFALIDALKNLSQFDRHRIMSITSVLGCRMKVCDGLIDERINSTAHLLRTESYLSTSGQTMLWGIWDVFGMQTLARQEWLADQKRASMGLPQRRMYWPGLQAYVAEQKANG